MITTTLGAVAGILAAGLVIVLALPRLRGLRTQLLAFSLSAVLLPTTAVVVAGLVMFRLHDVAVLSLVTAASAAATAGIAVVIASRLAAGVRRFRDAGARLAAGELDVRMPEDGPSELRQVAVSFNEMARALARLIETRRNLVAWASHDLRAPLASLQAMIEALQDRPGDPDRYLPEMGRQVRMLSGMVDDLFELSRIEMGALELELTEVPVAELAAACVRSLEPQAEALGVRLELLAPDNPARARCAPDKIERVLMNLLTNALRHTPHDGSVAVRVGTDAGAVTVAVEDSGDGIPKENLGRVFDSFWRADRSRSASTGGAGLGLAIARGLVEAHGGRIWVDNRPGGGARFVFTLPIA